MQLFQIRFLALMLFVLAVTLLSGCSQPNTILKTGMKMQAAIDAMNDRGIQPVQMQIGNLHNAFNLPDGRTIVLLGDATVDGITIIENPNVPRSKRTYKAVSEYEF